MKKTLTPEDCSEVYDALEAARARDDGDSWRAGSHFVLMQVLQRFGISARGRQQAEREAEKLLRESGW